jgi:hypothetical protein
MLRAGNSAHSASVAVRYSSVGRRDAAAGEKGQVGLDGFVGVDGFVAEGDVDVAVPGDDLGDVWREAVQTGSERFTNRVEYLKSRSGEMGALVLLGAPLPLPQMHQCVARRYRS